MSLFAQSPDYYQSAQQLTGDELRNELHEIIKAHNEFSYSSTKNILKLSDQDPENENNIKFCLCFYKSLSSKSIRPGGGGNKNKHLYNHKNNNIC